MSISPLPEADETSGSDITVRRSRRLLQGAPDQGPVGGSEQASVNASAGLANSATGRPRSVYSEVGRGTTLKIYLPRLDDPTTTNEPTKPAAAVPPGNEVVLVVEDEPMVRTITVRSLRAEGYTVFEATNGVEALGLIDAQAGALDLLVTDVIMPLMGGKELAARLSAKYPDVSVLYTKVKLVTRKAFGYRQAKTIKIALFHALGRLPEPKHAHRFA